MPKARPRIGEDQDGLEGGLPMLPDMISPAPIMPGMGGINQLFQQMDRQMQQMMQMQKQYINPPGSERMLPPGMHPILPGPEIKPDSPKPPRYDDPNAI
jgi:hypothetical protein